MNACLNELQTKRCEIGEDSDSVGVLVMKLHI